MWTRTIPVVSTEHIKPRTIERLRALDEFSVADYGFGDYVILGERGDDFTALFAIAPELEPIVQWLHAEFPDGTWIAFDADGDHVDDLPIYEW